MEEFIDHKDPITYLCIPEVQRSVTRGDYISLLVLSLLVWVSFFAVYIPGLYSEWYATLKDTGFNTWIPRIGGRIAAELSYYGIYHATKHVHPSDEYRIPTLAILYIIGNFILIGWSGSFFQGENFAIAVPLSGILFIYEYWIFLYLWKTDQIAAAYNLPLLFMYLYLFYSMVQLERLNT